MTGHTCLSSPTKIEWLTQCKSAAGETKKTYEAIRKNFKTLLGKPSCSQIYKKASKTKKLILNNSKLSDLRPLNIFTNLKHLELKHNHISDISALSELSELRTIHLTENLIEDLEPLANHKNLTQLYLEKNRISDLSPLAMLPLSDLGLSHNRVRDINPLSTLTHLSILDLTDNFIDDFSPLENLLELEWIIDNNGLILDLAQAEPQILDSNIFFYTDNSEHTLYSLNSTNRLSDTSIDGFSIENEEKDI